MMTKPPSTRDAIILAADYDRIVAELEAWRDFIVSRNKTVNRFQSDIAERITAILEGK